MQSKVNFNYKSNLPRSAIEPVNCQVGLVCRASELWASECQVGLVCSEPVNAK